MSDIQHFVFIISSWSQARAAVSLGLWAYLPVLHALDQDHPISIPVLGRMSQGH